MAFLTTLWVVITNFVKKRINNVGNDSKHGIRQVVDLYCTSRFITWIGVCYLLQRHKNRSWLYSKFDRSVDFLVERWGWTWLEQPEDAWRKKYPYVTKKIDELEERLEKLEK